MANKPSSGSGHPDCYARALRECGGPIESEHYASDAVLSCVSQGEATVRVRNLTFQKPETQEVRGIANLTAKVLCKKHNGKLSPFDAAGKSLFHAMDQINSTVGKAVGTPEIIKIDGDHLERWLLKVLCGGLFSGNFPLPEGMTTKGVDPPKEWLELLFRDGVFPPGHGLYVWAGAGAPFKTDPSVLKFKVQSEGDKVIVAFTVWIFNFEFNLALARLPPEQSQSLTGLIYRPRGLVVHGSSKRIEFQWEGRAGVGDELHVEWLDPLTDDPSAHTNSR